MTERFVNEIPARGMDLLDKPAWNKGTAFTDEERTLLGLHGLLPPYVETLDQQVVRAYAAFRAYGNDLGRHINLRALQDTNEVLYYRLLLDHVEEMVPIVYTPVVADACRQFSHIYRKPRGLFVSYPLRDHIPALLRSRPHAQVDVIVVTDGERILGIGDQGVGGMGIPVGKLALYTLIGGIEPARTLPIVLDVGTNNEKLLHDPEYLGWRHERITGQEYDDFVHRFVEAVKQEMPNTCLQWEDFGNQHARPILERYRDELLTFNDDIQGTAAVALGAVTAGCNVTGSKLKDQQVVMFGAGTASLGVADYIREAMMSEGLSDKEARRHFWVIDSHGLVHDGRNDLSSAKRAYAQSVSCIADWPHTSNGNPGLAEVIGNIRATVLIGLSTVAGAFTEPVVREMSRKVERPIIFPLSNPTDKSEATAQELIEWSDGRALVATGSPFAPVHYGGRNIKIPQCNNVYIFPAVGLAVQVAGARRINDAMMLAAARALGENSPALRDRNEPLLPPLSSLRKTAIEIAFAVAEQAQRDGLASNMCDDLRERLVASQWSPTYPKYTAIVKS